MSANTYGRQVVEALTNKSGGGVVAGDVVVIDTTNNDAFTTSTAGGFLGTIGIAQETIASNAVGRILTAGYAALVNVNASVTRGNFGKTYTVAKQATDAGASRGAGAFCQFLTGGTTPDAHLFGIADASTAASGVPAGTSFPGSPADGDLFYRTDIDMLFRYRSTGTRWVSTHQIAITAAQVTASVDQASALSASSFFGISTVPYKGTYGLWLDRFEVSFQYGGGTIDGTKYWAFNLNYTDSATSRTLIAGTGNLTTDSASTAYVKGVSIAAVLSTNAVRFEWQAVKTSTSPNILGIGATLLARIIAT